MATKISWCDETINPIVGCSKISEGCQNCYAENMAARLASMGLGQYQSVTSFRRWNGLTALVSSELEKPFKWKKPRSIFISSMGDLFHETAPPGWHNQIMHMVHGCPQHTFIILTKRAKRMNEYFVDYAAFYGSPAANLVVGVSVENQETADERIPELLNTPAARRFISLEPMTGPVSIDSGRYSYKFGSATKKHDCGIHGVILGGESGNRGRRLDPLWVIQVRDQCAAAGVPFMFKQWSHENRNEVDERGFPYLQDNRTHSELAWKVNESI